MSQWGFSGVAFELPPAAAFALPPARELLPDAPGLAGARV